MALVLIIMMMMKVQHNEREASGRIELFEGG